MTEVFKMAAQQAADGTTTLTIGFGAPASNSDIVKFVDEAAPALSGKLLLVNGPASLPVAFVLAHRYMHLFATIGVFDPKLNSYVVVSNHGGDKAVGDLIPA